MMAMHLRIVTHRVMKLNAISEVEGMELVQQVAQVLLETDVTAAENILN